MPSERPPQLINSLTGLRAVGALAVVYYHFYQGLEGPLQPIVQSGGYLGVALFFALSGYILAYVHGQERRWTSADWIDFLARRVARIYPLHVFMIIVLIVLVPEVSGASAIDFPANLTLTHAWFSNRLTLIGASWSISVEFLCYLLFPFFLKLRKGKRAEWCFICLATINAVFAAGFLKHTPVGEFMDRRVIHYGAFFVLGLCVFFITERRSSLSRALGSNAALAGVSALIVAACYAPILQPIWPFILPLLMRPVHMAPASSRLLGNPVMVFLGEISFAIYLSHQLLVYVVAKYAPGWPVMDVTVAWSVCCYLMVEKPCRAAARSLLAQRQSKISQPAVSHLQL